MKKLFFTLTLIAILYACSSRPKNFTYIYEDINTGLDAIIPINGYYISQHGCDSAFYSMYIFYSNGLFAIVTAGKITPELMGCFIGSSEKKPCGYPVWGVYKIVEDTIKTQVIRQEGNKCVIFRDYLITKDRRIVNISDYVQPQYTNMAYMANYPSFTNNLCRKRAEFCPLQFKPDSTACPFLNKRWFKAVF